MGNENLGRLFFEEHIAQDSKVDEHISSNTFCKVHLICFSKLSWDSSYQETLICQMIEREGLVEEPDQDKDTDKIKEGIVEEDGKNLTPFDFTIIGITSKEHHVWSG